MGVMNVATLYENLASTESKQRLPHTNSIRTSEKKNSFLGLRYYGTQANEKKIKKASYVVRKQKEMNETKHKLR